MKFPIIITLLMLSVSCGKVVQKNENPLLIAGETALSGKDFFYYDKDDRVQVLKEMYHSMKSSYALWDIKKEVIGVDGDKIFQDAIAYEKSLKEQTSEFDQAKSNLLFMDRLKKIVASFRDTHLGGYAINKIPFVQTGLITSLTTDGVIVRKKAKPILSFGREEELPVKVGDKVISIDGKKVEEHIDHLKQYIDGSTESYREWAASYYLAERNFSLPTKNYTDWELENSEGETYQVRLPWYHEDASERLDAKAYFQELDFNSLTMLSLDYNRKEGKWGYEKDMIKDYEGFKETDAPKNLQNETEWKDKKTNRTIIRTGHFFKKGKVYGYLAMFNFKRNQKLVNDKILKEDEESEGIDYIEIARNFVKELKENEIPLIIDVRNNSGGSMELAQDITSLIAKKDDSYPRVTLSYRITRLLRQMFETFDYQPEFQEVISEDSWGAAEDEIARSISEGREYTYSFSDVDNGIRIKADKDVGGYEQDVVVLLDDNCISACDIFSMSLIETGRATFIGSQSNGTGAGMLSTSSYDSMWKDSFFLFKLNIPNILFGFPVDKEIEIIEEKNSHLTLNSENRPVKAQIQYDYSKRDLLEPSIGWIEKAIEQLSGEKIETIEEEGKKED